MLPIFRAASVCQQYLGSFSGTQFVDHFLNKAAKLTTFLISCYSPLRPSLLVNCEIWAILVLKRRQPSNYLFVYKGEILKPRATIRPALIALQISSYSKLTPTF